MGSKITGQFGGIFMKRGVVVLLGLTLTTLGALASASGQSRSASAAGNLHTPAPDLFTAMATGDLEVKLIAQDSKSGTVIVRNTTNRPLTVRLPDVFAGVPVLAQGRGAGGAVGGAGGNGAGGYSGNQGLGGAFGGGGLGGGGLGGGGFFCIEPVRVTKLKVAAVCLEHGKLEPNPRVDYELAPIAQLTNDPAVVEVVRMLGRRE